MQGISHYNILRQFTCISRRHYRSGRPPPASASVVIVSVVPRAAGCCCRRGRAGTRGRRDRPATPPRGASLLNVLITGYVPSYDLIIKKCAARSHAGVTRMSGPSLTAESCEQFKINRRVASCAVRLSGCPAWGIVRKPAASAVALTPERNPHPPVLDRIKY